MGFLELRQARGVYSRFTILNENDLKMFWCFQSMKANVRQFERNEMEDWNQL